MAEGESLAYLKWYFNKTDALESFVKDGLITKEQAADLFFAVQAYAKTGEERDLSDPALIMQYKTLCIDIDKAKKKYVQKCETNRRNGAKGGKAKAEKAAAKGSEAAPAAPAPEKPKFKPPTLTQFKNAVEHFNENEWDGEADYSDYDIESLYDELNENGWVWKDRFAIQSREDWEKLIQWRFGTYSAEISGFRLIDWDLLRWTADAYPFEASLSKLANIADDVEDYLEGADIKEPRYISTKIREFIKSHFIDNQEREDQE